jgi:uncharacterized membrane protein SirB2
MCFFILSALVTFVSVIICYARLVVKGKTILTTINANKIMNKVADTMVLSTGLIVAVKP